MAARLTLPKTAAWVWHDQPRSIFGLEAVFVRCGSGTGGSAPGGFSYADNFQAWSMARGPAVIPWFWFGPPASSDGVASADALCAVAPRQRVYVVEVAPETPPGQVAVFADRLRQREPVAALGFSTWPTRAEAEQAAVPWDVCVEVFDFGLPQVYTPIQRELLLRDNSPVVEDMAGKPIHVAVFPDADPGWMETARLGVLEHAGVSAWAVDQSSFSNWRRQLGALGEGRLELPAPVPAEQPEPRPLAQEPDAQPSPPMHEPDPRPRPPMQGPDPQLRPPVQGPDPEPRESLTPIHFDEPGELTLLANRILAVVQTRLDEGGKLTDDDLVGKIEAVLRDGDR